MGFKFLENLIDRIAQYLPDDEPATEAERIYEEGKKRVYELHQNEQDLFYIEEAWMEKSEVVFYGENAKGSFRIGNRIFVLDIHGLLLKELTISEIKDEPEEEKDPNRNSKRQYLKVEWAKEIGEEDFFVRACYLVKKN